MIVSPLACTRPKPHCNCGSTSSFEFAVTNLLHLCLKIPARQQAFQLSTLAGSVDKGSQTSCIRERVTTARRVCPTTPHLWTPSKADGMSQLLLRQDQIFYSELALFAKSRTWANGSSFSFSKRRYWDACGQVSQMSLSSSLSLFCFSSGKTPLPHNSRSVKVTITSLFRYCVRQRIVRNYTVRCQQK